MRCQLCDATGVVAGRVLLRVPAGPASTVLDAVLRRALAERRRGRMLAVAEPQEVAALLGALGLGAPEAITP